ncbi:MAG: hypothetical protein U9O78_00655 [Patescibacteria group bacterium]|nr:hypothetical protein [Patescibacteria group bacterium]
MSDKSEEKKIRPAIRPLSELVRQYLAEYQLGIEYQNRIVANPIQVDELASKLAKLYEKVRRIIDWKEENLIRRTAIERILKRNLLSELSGLGFAGGLDANKISKPLVMEMIRSGYFTNGKISKSKIPEARKTLAKYIYILNYSTYTTQKSLNIKDKINFFNWILEIAACELEEILEPSFKENALINLMTTAIYQNLTIKPHDAISQEDKLLQTYIAVHRTLYTLESPIITYNLIKYRYPRWFEEESRFLEEFTQQIEEVKKQLEADLEYEKSGEFFKVCERYDAAYLILGDIMKELEKDPDELVENLKKPEVLEKTLETVYKARVKTLKKRLMKSAIYSTLSIFAAGIVSFIIFEGPVAHWLAEEGFKPFALFVDLAVPSALMFLLVIMIKPPKKENLARVKEEVKKIVYPLDQDDLEYEISFKKKKNWIANLIFRIISLAAGAVSVYAIYWVFKIAGVPWTSIYVDTVNVAMVIFAGMIIRHKSKEITIEERGSLISMFIDLFSIPLAKVGQWFSKKWKEYNILSVFFTALIDAPFSMIVTIIEDWRMFLRDKRSEIH